MSKSGRFSLGLIDLLGGCTVAVCLVGSAWLVLVQNKSNAAGIDGLSRQIQAAQEETRELVAACDRQRGTVIHRQEELAKTGQLPSEAPIEEYFQTLSATASHHRLRVVRHNPLPFRQYPGMLEQRYAYEVSGTTLSLVRFLKSIEQSTFWADVSYLKIENAPGAQVSGDSDRVASLTISLFSASPIDASADREDG